MACFERIIARQQAVDTPIQKVDGAGRLITVGTSRSGGGGRWWQRQKAEAAERVRVAKIKAKQKKAARAPRVVVAAAPGGAGEVARTLAERTIIQP